MCALKIRLLQAKSSSTGPWVPLQSSRFALVPNALIECNYRAKGVNSPVQLITKGNYGGPFRVAVSAQSIKKKKNIGLTHNAVYWLLWGASLCFLCRCLRVVETHSFVAVSAEEACVVAFLYNNVGDARLVLLLQADTGLANGQQLIIQHLRKPAEKIHHQSFIKLSLRKKDQLHRLKARNLGVSLEVKSCICWTVSEKTLIKQFHVKKKSIF